MPKRLEEKWRAMPPERELQVRMEILTEEQRGLDEAQATRETAKPNTSAFRLADRDTHHFLGRVGKTQKRITKLRDLLATKQPIKDISAARARKLRKLYQNSQTMLGRFLVVTPGFNQAFLKKLEVTELGDFDVNAVLQTERIQLITLDNPERWTPQGSEVVPKKFLALHPMDVNPAIRVLKAAMVAPTSKVEQSERSTIIWLPPNKNDFQHPDEDRTTYPPKITRLALDLRDRSSHPGWAVLRGWGTNLDAGVDPINDCEVDFEAVPNKGRFQALLDPDELEEILF